MSIRYKEYNEILKKADNDKYMDYNLSEVMVVEYSSFEEMRQLASALLNDVDMLEMKQRIGNKYIAELELQTQQDALTIGALQGQLRMPCI